MAKILFFSIAFFKKVAQIIKTPLMQQNYKQELQLMNCLLSFETKSDADINFLVLIL